MMKLAQTPAWLSITAISIVFFGLMFLDCGGVLLGWLTTGLD
jgi:hypothetical protein